MAGDLVFLDCQECEECPCQPWTWDWEIAVQGVPGDAQCDTLDGTYLHSAATFRVFDTFVDYVDFPLEAFQPNCEYISEIDTGKTWSGLGNDGKIFSVVRCWSYLLASVPTFAFWYFLVARGGTKGVSAPIQFDLDCEHLSAAVYNDGGTLGCGATSTMTITTT